MKFEIDIHNRNMSVSELTDDLIKVAKELDKDKNH